MPDPEDPAEAAARLESALERISALANRPVFVASAKPAPLAECRSIDTGIVAARLDALIARLRDALDTSRAKAAPGMGPGEFGSNTVRGGADEA